MSTRAPDISKTDSPASRPATDPPPFGVNELRLTARQWLAVGAIVLITMAVLPRLAALREPFKPGPDYRIPYPLSKDYWLYQRRLGQDAGADRVLLLGDSVIWGEYVRPDGTLSHFLNAQAGPPGRFINGGVNGLFPLAMEGLVDDYAKSLRGKKVIVHCNLLWMSSPKADLSVGSPETFNHSRLVPQFFPRIPCYSADANERLSAVLENHVNYLAWTGHIEYAYHDGLGIGQWTLEEDGREPPGSPHAWQNPLPDLSQGPPGEPAVDPQRGPVSRRHRPWNVHGSEPADFEWVNLGASFQWQAFGRVVRKLRSRGDDVLVLLGPFNEHMIAADQRDEYRRLRDAASKLLTVDGVPVLVPEALPSPLYADASHPLTEGYAELAAWMLHQPQFTKWLAR